MIEAVAMCGGGMRLACLGLSQVEVSPVSLDVEARPECKVPHELGA
jgi:hypothetical protein